MKVLIKDELLSGKSVYETEIDFASEIVTVQDIITLRVNKEVEDYNNRLPEYFNGLVEPGDAEKTLNGYKLKPKKVIDAEKQVYIALDAFLKNGFFVLIDTLQAETLEQEVQLQSNTTISFVKLTPLIGG